MNRLGFLARACAARMAAAAVVTALGTTMFPCGARAQNGTSVGHLQHVQHLAPVFARLRELEEGRASNDVRIQQFGDSHTASDYGTSVLRDALATRFGDGGRGFVPIGEPYKRLFQAGEVVSGGTDFRPEEGRFAGGRFVGDGLYGPAGIAMVGRLAGAKVFSRYSTAATSLEVAYLEAPGGGSFDVWLDGKKLARVTTKRDAPAAAFKLFDVEDGAHRVELRAVGDGEVRVFGVTLDRRPVGIVLDALGINGAKASTPLDWDDTHAMDQLRHAQPALVLFAYGTNESGDGTAIEDHRRAIGHLAQRLKRAVPKAACLVLGPPDRTVRKDNAWVPSPRIAEIVAVQRDEARVQGCAFFDQWAAMGGAGAIDRWARESPPRARSDRVHLTRDGYRTLARALSEDLLTAYAAWKGR